MGQITTGVGLVSGIDIAGLVDQLMALEQRPKQLIQRQNALLGSQQVAFQDINAKLLSVDSAISGLTKVSGFNPTTATSSNENAITVSSTSSASPGTYSFTVARTVASQQTITKGFSDLDATPLGESTLTFEFGGGSLVQETRLAELNGGNGVARGKISITDRSGNSAIVDLTSVASIDDVIDKINNTSGINVTAAVEGNHLTIADNTGSTLSDLSVRDLGLSTTAADLGIAGQVAAATLTGTDINYLSRDTLLANLNDGLGVRMNSSGQNDFRIKSHSGYSFDVDLGAASTVGDVLDAINNHASNTSIVASVSADGSGITLTDASAVSTNMQVTALSGSKAADDLGIRKTVVPAGGPLVSSSLIAGINTRLLSSLNGGNGVTFSAGADLLSNATRLDNLFGGAGLTTNGNDQLADISITSHQGDVFEIELDDLVTVGDLINRISTQSGGDIGVTIAAGVLTATDNSGAGPSNFIIQNTNGATAATQLGITTNTTNFKVTGGFTNPLAGTEISITDRAGANTVVDLATASTVQDVVDLINASGADVIASLNEAKNGIRIEDNTGLLTGTLTIEDVNGSAATDLGLAQSVTDNDFIDSGNLQHKYIGEATLLKSLNGGKGVAAGKFKITDSSGASATVDLSQGDETTIQHVISEINSRGIAVRARINDTGDGLLIEDLGLGAVEMKIEEEGSTTAADLGILGTASGPGENIDGSFETTIEVTATDTLQDVANKINDAGIAVKATIINDGSFNSPFRLSLQSRDAGKAGAFVFDDGGLGMEQVTLNRARNALMFFGGDDPATAIAIENTSNTFNSVIPGATLTVNGVSDSPVNVTISRDDASIVKGVEGLVKAFNTVFDALDKYDTYDQETEERGLLLGDGTVLRVRQALQNVILRRSSDLGGTFDHLSQLGIRMGSGARVEFNADKFRAALDTDFEAVKDLFTYKQTETDDDTNVTTTTARGIGVAIQEVVDRLSDGIDGTIKNRVDSLQKIIDNNNDRIEDIDDLLASKRARLEAEFIAMERALADLQNQSSALANFQIPQIQSSNRNRNNN